MTKNYCTIEDLSATFEFIEPSKEAAEAYQRAVKQAEQTIFGFDPARAPSTTVITHYSGGRVVSTETLEDVSFFEAPPHPIRDSYSNEESLPITREGLAAMVEHVRSLKPSDDHEPPPEIPVREYAPPRVPDLCPDDHDPQTCPDGCPICMPF